MSTPRTAHREPAGTSAMSETLGTTSRTPARLVDDDPREWRALLFASGSLSDLFRSAACEPLRTRPYDQRVCRLRTTPTPSSVRKTQPGASVVRRRRGFRGSRPAFDTRPRAARRRGSHRFRRSFRKPLRKQGAMVPRHRGGPRNWSRILPVPPNHWSTPPRRSPRPRPAQRFASAERSVRRRGGFRADSCRPSTAGVFRRTACRSSSTGPNSRLRRC